MDKSRIQDWSKQQLFAGIDLHKKKWVVTVRTVEVELKTFSLPANKQALLKTFRRHWTGAKIEAVYEAGCFGYHLAEFLTDHGIETMIVSPHNIPVKRGHHVKTDKIDSRRLALELSKASMEGIYQPSLEALHDRTVVRTRSKMLKARCQVQSQIKSELTFYGIEVDTTKSGYWSKRYVQQLKQVAFGDEGCDRAFKLLVGRYEQVKCDVRAATRMITEMSRKTKYREKVSILKTVPGISTLTAMILLTETVDMKRFSSHEKFASYLGLIPSEYSSGEKVHKGGLVHMGKSVLRRILVEASWVGIRRDPVLLTKFKRISRGNDKTKAIIAVAKTLAHRIRRIVLYHEPYVIGVIQ